MIETCTQLGVSIAQWSQTSKLVLEWPSQSADLHPLYQSKSQHFKTFWLKKHRDNHATAQQINVFDKSQQLLPDFGGLFLIEHFLDIISIVAAAKILKEEQARQQP